MYHCSMLRFQCIPLKTVPSAYCELPDHSSILLGTKWLLVSGIYCTLTSSAEHESGLEQLWTAAHLRASESEETPVWLQIV